MDQKAGKLLISIHFKKAATMKIKKYIFNSITLKSHSIVELGSKVENELEPDIEPFLHSSGYI